MESLSLIEALKWIAGFVLGWYTVEFVKWIWKRTVSTK